MAYIGKYLFVLLWVPYCIVYSAHSGALYKISNPGLSTARGWGGRRRWQRRRVIVVIVLLYTLSHSAISVLKIMSPSNEVRLLLLFIISCHSQELLCAVCLGDVFKKASLNEHIWIVMWFFFFFFPQWGRNNVFSLRLQFGFKSRAGCEGVVFCQFLLFVSAALQLSQKWGRSPGWRTFLLDHSWCICF